MNVREDLGKRETSVVDSVLIWRYDMEFQVSVVSKMYIEQAIETTAS